MPLLSRSASAGVGARCFRPLSTCNPGCSSATFRVFCRWPRRSRSMYRPSSRRAGITEKDEDRAATLIHAVRDRDCRPMSSFIKALNNRAPLMPGHEQMIWILGIDDGRVRNPGSPRQAPHDSWSTHAAIVRFPESYSGAAYARPNKELEAVQPGPVARPPAPMTPVPPCPELIGPDHVRP